MPEAEWGSCEPFGIDNGELDGQTPQQCFVLGYELAQIHAQADQPYEFSKPVHAQNQERIGKALRDRGRVFRLTWMEDDTSENWMWLAVAGIEPPACDL